MLRPLRQPEGGLTTAVEGDDKGPWTGGIGHDGAFHTAGGVVQLAVGEEAAVGGDPGAVELQPEAAM